MPFSSQFFALLLVLFAIQVAAGIWGFYNQSKVSFSVKWCASLNNVAWKVLGRSKQMRTLSLECVPYKCILFDTSEDIINICIFIIYIFILFLYYMYAIRTNDAVLINVFCCVVAGSRWHHNILRADVQQLQDHRGRGAQGDTALNSKRG